MNTTAKPVQKDTQDNKDNKDTDEGKDTGKGNGAGSGSDTSYQTPDAGGYSNGEAAYSGGVSVEVRMEVQLREMVLFRV